MVVASCGTAKTALRSPWWPAVVARHCQGGHTLSPCGARLVGRLALRLALRMRHHVARDLVEVLLALHTRGWEERWEKRGTR